jgi:hypothetical protein
MAYGEIKVSGDDVYEALTECNRAGNYERVLNNEGHKLAELIAKRVLAILQAKLSLDLPDDE